ncbi:TPA: PD-(D/E)XK nuclease family protein [Burkholderia vietnamiensis]|nr:PD-(D/E)XK nuclease family protein [Burkholderia vietnamiensis]
MDDAFQEFVADPRLRKAMEGLKRSNDIFNIIDPNENQHSEILKWLFDPREGHGQGDGILKDFLTAAYGNSYENVLCNKEFFAVWTPSRIARTGFHSMIAIREYVLPSKARLDLLMIDPVNQLLVVVENKHGARLGPEQLETYYNEVALLRARPAFKGYKTAHIVLDRNYGGARDEDDNRSAPRNRWAFLDYQWLEAGADRAELQIKRGNQSAALVIAYCQKQTDYVPPEQKELDDVLADVAMDYRTVIEDLEKALTLDVSALTPTTLDGDVGEKWIFAHHYPELIERLGSNAKLSFIERRIKANLPYRKLLTDYGKKIFWLFDEAWGPLIGADAASWPVCVVAWEMRESIHGPDNYAVGIQYRPLNLEDGYRAKVQTALEEEFPELKKGRRSASFRMLGKVANLSESGLPIKAQAVYSRLRSALGPVVDDPV